jgi:predicted PurR-regulated permease PerM
VFFTTALYPAVDWMQRRMPWCPRSLATLLVFVVVLLALGGLLAAFAVPLARQGTQVAGQLPDMIVDARNGCGPVGDLLARTHALEYVQQNQSRIREFATSLGAPALNVVRGLATGIVAAITCRARQREQPECSLDHACVASGANAPRSVAC